MYWRLYSTIPPRRSGPRATDIASLSVKFLTLLADGPLVCGAAVAAGLPTYHGIDRLCGCKYGFGL